MRCVTSAGTASSSRRKIRKSTSDAEARHDDAKLDKRNPNKWPFGEGGGSASPLSRDRKRECAARARAEPRRELDAHVRDHERDARRSLAHNRRRLGHRRHNRRLRHHRRRQRRLRRHRRQRHGGRRPRRGSAPSHLIAQRVALVAYRVARSRELGRRLAPLVVEQPARKGDTLDLEIPPASL